MTLNGDGSLALSQVSGGSTVVPLRSAARPNTTNPDVSDTHIITLDELRGAPPKLALGPLGTLHAQRGWQDRRKSN